MVNEDENEGTCSPLKNRNKLNDKSKDLKGQSIDTESLSVSPTDSFKQVK